MGCLCTEGAVKTSWLILQQTFVLKTPTALLTEELTNLKLQIYLLLCNTDRNYQADRVTDLKWKQILVDGEVMSGCGFKTLVMC